MKLSKFVLPAIAALSLAACGNLSKVSKEGTTDNPVWPDAANHPASRWYSTWFLAKLG